MDLSRYIISPTRLDELREAFEDEFAALRIRKQLPLKELAQDICNECGKILVPFQVDGVSFFGIIDTNRHIEITGDIPDYPIDVVLGQSMFFDTAAIVGAVDYTDLVMGLYAEVVVAPGETSYFYLTHEFDRAIGRRVRISLMHSEKAIVSLNGHHVALNLPPTRDIGLKYVQADLYQYAMRQGLDPASLDPTRDWISGFESWHESEQPSEFLRLKAESRLGLLTWIHWSFCHASSLRSAPGTSYRLKHYYEDLDRYSIPDWRFFDPGYVSNGEFKGAMIAAGFLPVNPGDLNHKYKIKVNPEIRRQFSRHKKVGL